eukprot:scaffold323_cov414-Prasinococcus_capsulatus_cf.AAC.50
MTPPSRHCLGPPTWASWRPFCLIWGWLWRGRRGAGAPPSASHDQPRPASEPLLRLVSWRRSALAEAAGRGVRAVLLAGLRGRRRLLGLPGSCTTTLRKVRDNRAGPALHSSTVAH